ncbi:MAG: hypothetical protein AB7I35_21770 [Ramlibacter sp.]
MNTQKLSYIQKHLPVTVCKDAADAVNRGFNYASAAPGEYKPIAISNVGVVLDGTAAGNPTVDLVLTDETGQKYVVTTTGALVKSIPCGPNA